jgi:hypothetical protein
MFYCTDCKKLVEEGEKTETESGEFWGARFTYETHTDCCSECGSTDIEEPWKCVCGEEIPPGEKLCENHKDFLNDVKKEIRNEFPGIAPVDQTTIEEYLIDNLFLRTEG